MYSVYKVFIPFLASLLWAPLGHSQEGPQKLAVEDVVGFVQYIDGAIDLKNPGARKARLDFKRLLYVEDSFSIQADDLIKVATIEGCTVVFYGPVEVSAPKNRGGLWSTEAGVQRWVCPEGKRQSIESKGEKIEVFRGELFLKDNDLMFFEGSGKIGNRVAIADVLHKHEKKWLPSTENYDLRDLKEDWDDDYPVPTEVVRTEIAGGRVDEYSLRLGLGPVFGYGFVELSGGDDDLSMDRGTAGIRLWASYDFESFSLYGSFMDFEYVDSENPIEGTWDGDHKNLEFRGELITLGVRMPLSQRLVYFASLGIGSGEVSTEFSDSDRENDSHFYNRDDYALYQLSVGVQKEFFDSNWFFVWSTLSIDFYYGNYTSTYERSGNTSSDNKPDLHGFVINFGLGPGFQL